MWLDKEDEGKIFIFYGRVKLNIDTVKSKKDSSVYYRLIINTKKRDGSWGYKTKVFRGQYKDEIECGREYDIAMLGHIKFYKKIPEIEVARNALLYRARQDRVCIHIKNKTIIKNSNFRIACII